jgi:molybdenum cofactor cytidylyltransferase
MNNFAAIILAAGASTRLGQPKQLLLHEGRTLIARTATAALDAGASPVIIVLGAHAEKIRPALASLPVLIAENPAWPEGMASSIATGLNTLDTAPIRSTPIPPSLDSQPSTPDSASPPSLLLAVCDQPHFSAAAIGKLRAALAANPAATIAATRHGDTAGVPAIFTRTHFPALAALRGPEGARRIIAANTTTTALVDLPELALDIDTPADLRLLA